MEFTVGSVLEGKVTGITKFGAFVALPGGRSGLVHISEIAYSYVSDVNEFLKEGQDVKVKVVNVDDAGRINLSIKKAMDPPPRPEGQSRPNANNGGGQNRPANHNNNSAPRSDFNRQPRGYVPPKQTVPDDFEGRLKLFMQQSDSKLSDLRQTEKRNNRRSGGGGGRR